ncbi:MAG TPA: DUF1289 domain-containing protein [Burkholderiales bacterium]|jgi:hypothetical protein|nr:DUF1289 domain-containing protein [Burkholderiales bacterium]
MKSPCVNVCQMDPRRGLCLGCARTLEEIARWGAMTDLERGKILAELPGRRKALNVPEVSVPPLA